MAYVTRRASDRYTAYYTDPFGRRRSAGTFTTKEEALVRARDAEANPMSPRSSVASQTYREYVTAWLATETRLLPQTLRGYESNLTLHVLPRIGHLKVGEVTTAAVVLLLTEIQAAGSSAFVAAQCKAAVGSSFKPLVPTVVPVNPTHGVKVSLPPSKPFDLVEPDEFLKIAMHLLPPARLFASFLVQTGARFGEASEVRVDDLNFRTNEVSFLRRVSQLGAKRTGGSRFLPVTGTKGGRQRGRVVVVPPDLMEALKRWVVDNGLQGVDLVFPKRLVIPGGRASATNTTGHLPNDQWRKIWRAAVEASGIGWWPRPHDLRHAFATHLVASGVSIYEVMELCGHSNIETTLKYQHRVEAQRSKAAEALGAFSIR